MGPIRPDSSRDLHELLTGMARIWGRLSLIRGRLRKLELELAEARSQLQVQTQGVEELERRSFRRLRAWLRGALPQVVERQQADFLEALHHHESLEKSLAENRQERDQLEAELAELSEEEERFSERTLQEARALREKREDPDASSPPPRDPVEELVHVQHDIADLEWASTALSATSHHLEAVHDALSRVARPGLLQVISGLALLDLFESPEIRLARESFEQARGEVQAAALAVEALETVTPSKATTETLSRLGEYRFLHGLYHEGKIARVLERSGKDVEHFREEVWELRNRLRSVKDGLLTRLVDLQASPPPEPH